MPRLLLAALAGAALLAAGTAPRLVSPSPLVAQAVPPDRFYGVLTIDGQRAPMDTLVMAWIGDRRCDTGRIERFAMAPGWYAVEVAAGCAALGDEITFQIGERVAQEKGRFLGGYFTKLDLNVADPNALATATRAATADPVPSPAPTPAPTSTPGPAPTPTPAPGTSPSTDPELPGPEGR